MNSPTLEPGSVVSLGTTRWTLERVYTTSPPLLSFVEERTGLQRLRTEIEVREALETGQMVLVGDLPKASSSGDQFPCAFRKDYWEDLACALEAWNLSSSLPLNAPTVPSGRTKRCDVVSRKR